MSRVNVDELQMQSAVPSRGAGHILTLSHTYGT